jgi:hypothetical protein
MLGDKMIALFTTSPTLIALLLMWSSSALGWPVEITIDRVGWLIIDAQIIFLVIGASATLISRKTEQNMPTWRIAANKWGGRVMAVFCLFYLVAFFLITLKAP